MSILLHVLTPVDPLWRDGLAPILGEPTELPIGHTDGAVLAWSLDEQRAREQGTLRKVWSVAWSPGPFDAWLGEQPEGAPLWPVYCFTVDRELTVAPVELTHRGVSDIVDTGAPLWFHFVSSGTGEVMTIPAADLAGIGGLWGTEEGYTCGADVDWCAGWWVTKDPGPHHCPATLHSVF